MGGPQSGHSSEWQRAYDTAKPEDGAQNQLVSQLALPIGDTQTREQAQRVNALQGLFSGLDPSTANRLYGRLSNSGDSLGQLFHLTLHHSTRASLMGVLDATRRSHDRGIGPDSHPTDDRKIAPAQPTPVPPPAPQHTPQQPAPPTGPATPVPSPPPRPWWLPWLTDPPQKPVAPPARQSPGIISRLLNLLTGHAKAMLGGLVLVWPAEWIAAAIAAAEAALADGATFGRAGEMAAKEMLKRQLEKKGLSGHVLDLNTIRKNFPGIDLMSSDRPWQVKMWGVTKTGNKFDVAMQIANAMVDLYGGGLRLPGTTANALLQVRERIIKEGAWPSSWPANPTLDQLKVLIQDTAFAVPDDLVGDVRSAFGKRLIENPKFRELIPELRIGSLSDPKTLPPLEQTRWAEKVTNFLFTHVQAVGVTTEQMKTMVEVARHLPKP